MWIMTSTGFVSIVRKTCPEGQLLVRARRRQDLQQLLGDDIEIVANAGSDYEFRACISEDRLAEIVASEIRSIDYSNYKDSIKDRPLHGACLAVWHDMAKLGR